LRRRELPRELAARREQLGLSQTVVAARMGTSQSAIARLVAAESDTKLSTLERFAAALGEKIEWRLGPLTGKSHAGPHKRSSRDLRARGRSRIAASS